MRVGPLVISRNLAQRPSRGWMHIDLDPRHYQVAVLSTLLLTGCTLLEFNVSVAQVAVTVASALTVQWAASALLSLPIDQRSALITALSLCLLLRTDTIWIAGAAAALAIGSKFILRVRGQHVFNPANLALSVCVLATPHAWISPGQWGGATLFAFAMAAAGFVVVTRAKRLDVTLAFLASYAGVIIGRTLWLGDPLTIAWHQLQSGSLLLFAFFMISDPKTTPRSTAGRIVFAVIVAAVAAAIRFNVYRADAVILALAACALLTPLIDAVMERRHSRSTQLDGRSLCKPA